MGPKKEAEKEKKEKNHKKQKAKQGVRRRVGRENWDP